MEGHYKSNKKFHPKETASVSAPKFDAKTDVKIKPQPKVEMSSTDDILSASYWKNTKTFKSIKEKETQIKYYKKMNSCEEVLQLVDLESKPFGSESEKIIQEIFKLEPRTSSQKQPPQHYREMPKLF
jgi:hypothetical protein